MFGLLVGALQLLVLLNACVRSIGGKWLVGSLGGALRVFLLIAITMASARIRGAGAEPTVGFTVALYAGPLLSVALLALASQRRRSMPAGSEAEVVADQIVKSWLGVVVIDAMLVVIGVAARVIATPP